MSEKFIVLEVDGDGGEGFGFQICGGEAAWERFFGRSLDYRDAASRG